LIARDCGEVEEAANRKLLGAALLGSTLLGFVNQKQKQRGVLFRLKSTAIQGRVAESAFNQLLEMNQRHSLARYTGGVALMGRFVAQYRYKEAFKEIRVY